MRLHFAETYCHNAFSFVGKQIGQPVRNSAARIVIAQLGTALPVAKKILNARTDKQLFGAAQCETRFAIELDLGRNR